MMMRLLVMVLSIAFSIPIQGVYASADSPSKYLDRMTTVNSSVNSESGGESSGAEGDTIVSHAVRVSHGVILNTVVRNANRLEYVDNVPVTTEDNDSTGVTGDGRNDLSYKTVAQRTDADSRGNAAISANIDGQSRGIEWLGDGLTGESTITYDANGKGQFADGYTTNQVTTKYNGYQKVTKYAHTDNVNDAGVKSGGYGNGIASSKVVSIPGAESLTVTITYQTEGTSWDWVCLYPGGTEGSPAGDKNCSTSGTVDNSGKLGGKTKTTQEFTVNGDSVTFWFRSDGSNDDYYGYYAVISGLINSKDTVMGSYQEPVDPTDDYDFNGWNTRADGLGENLGKDEVYSPDPLTVYAQWKFNWNKWGTVGWKITDDGVLRIRPWEGDTGTTGTSIYYDGAPWYSRRLEIRNIETTGKIVLNPWSEGLFYDCQNLTSLNGVQDWDTSQVRSLDSTFRDCSSLTSLEPLANWNTSQVTNLNITFGDCFSLTSLKGLEDWDTSQVRSLNSTFTHCYLLTSLKGLENWDTSQVRSSTYTFWNCRRLRSLNGVQGWDTSKVTNLSYTFYDCSSLTSLEALANWDTSKVTNLSYTFYNCSSLTSLEGLEGWDTSKVMNLAYTFGGCSSLTSLKDLEGWDTSKVTNLSYTFYNCSSLTSLEALANWDTSKVTSLRCTFYNCSSLTDASAIKNWSLNNVTDWDYTFVNCSKLQKVGIPSIANGGQKLVANASVARLPSTALGSRIITEDLQQGPFTWTELNTEMSKNPAAFDEGHVWVRYTPSWIVTYNANGGVGAQDRSAVPFSKSLTLPESQFLRFGYRFTGWTTQSGLVSSGNPLMPPGTAYKPDNPVDGEKYPLYAQWEKIGGEEDQPVTGQSGTLPGWVQVGSGNTRNDIIPNQLQSVVFTNKYDPGLTSIQFRFTKLMDGNVPDSSESFQFELINVKENRVIQTTVNNGASVQFQPITYDKPDEYLYYVRESPSSPQDNVNSNPSIDYDDHLIEVKVTVTEADDATSPSGKKLTATAQVTGDTVFRNESKPASLVISKTVTGVTEGMNENHKDREFTFKVNLLNRDNQPVSNTVYPTLITSKDDNTTDDSNQPPITSTITFKDGQAVLSLKAGQEVQVNGIPAGYKYTVNETDLPAGYVNASLSNPSGILTANSSVKVDAVNDYTVKPVNVTLQAGKRLMGPSSTVQSVSNREFQFTLCKVNDTDNATGQDTGITGNDSSVSSPTDTCTGVSEAWNDGNGVITFPQLSFDTIGVYTYQIREVKGSTLDMDYDSTVYTVVITVTDDGQGGLVAGITYRNDATGKVITPSSMITTGALLTNPESLGPPCS